MHALPALVETFPPIWQLPFAPRSCRSNKKTHQAQREQMIKARKSTKLLERFACKSTIDADHRMIKQPWAHVLSHIHIATVLTDACTFTCKCICSPVPGTHPKLNFSSVLPCKDTNTRKYRVPACTSSKAELGCFLLMPVTIWIRNSPSKALLSQELLPRA